MCEVGVESPLGGIDGPAVDAHLLMKMRALAVAGAWRTLCSSREAHLLALLKQLPLGDSNLAQVREPRDRAASVIDENHIAVAG